MPVAETDLLSVVVQKKSCVKAASTTAAMGKPKAAGLLRRYSTTFSCGGFSANPMGRYTSSVLSRSSHFPTVRHSCIGLDGYDLTAVLIAIQLYTVETTMPR